MADERALSISKVIAGLGGALLLASYFLPLVAADGRDELGRAMFGVQALRERMGESGDLNAVRPLLEPALQDIERFVTTPSLLNVSTVIGTSRELLDGAASLGVPDAPDMRRMSQMLGWARACLWALPLVGLVQLLLPALSRFRGYAGFLGLVARFGFGLLFVLVAVVPIAGVAPEQQAFLGSAVWTLLCGSLLMMAASLLGVSRSNWWMVVLADVAIVVIAVSGLYWLSGMLRH